MIDPQEYVNILLEKPKEEENSEDESEDDSEEEYFINTTKKQGYLGFSEDYQIQNPYLRRVTKRVKAERKLQFYRFLSSELNRLGLQD